MLRAEAATCRESLSRLLLMGLLALIAGVPGIARGEGETTSARAPDAALAEALRRGASAWQSQDGWDSAAVRALVETGETGQAVAVELSRSGEGEIRAVATALIARAEQEGSWDALLPLAELRPRPALPQPDPAAEDRALDDLEARLPQLEAEFPGVWMSTGCGNSSIGEHSRVLGDYVRLGSRACPSLARLARDADAMRRLRALQVLRVTDCPARSEIVERALGDADPRVRREAVTLLTHALGAACRHRDALSRLLADADVDCRLRAAGALAGCGDDAALPVLLASARIAAETDDERLLADHAKAAYHLRSLTSHIAPGGGDTGSPEQQRETARWWTEWGKAHATGFDVRAAHLEALRAAIGLVRTNPRIVPAPEPPGRRADIGVLLELDEGAAIELLLEDVAATRRARFNVAASLGTASHSSEAALMGLERIARDENAAQEARREAVGVVARLDAERARALVVSLLRSSRPGDRDAAWGPVSRELAPDEMRRTALTVLASPLGGSETQMYRDLRELATAEDCAVLLPIVVAEFGLADQIAGWGLLAHLGCPAAKKPMRALLSDCELGPWLVGPIASYRDLAVIPDLPCVRRPCPDRNAGGSTLHALAIVLNRRSVPGLVHDLTDEDPARRYGAAAALRQAIRERPQHPALTKDGWTDFTTARIQEPYVRAALDRAGARADDPAAALAREAVALLDAGGSVPAR